MTSKSTIILYWYYLIYSFYANYLFSNGSAFQTVHQQRCTQGRGLGGQNPSFSEAKVMLLMDDIISSYQIITFTPVQIII